MGAAPTSDQLTEPAARDLLSLAQALARSAAAVLRDRAVDLDVSTKSSPTDVVTVMDKAAERVILDGLAAARPGDAITSEESAATAGSTEVRWIIDPLDGTVNYLYGIPHYAVSIAAEVSGTVVAGVVLRAEDQVEYTALAGEGAWCDGVPIACSTQTDPAQSLAATGFSYLVDLRRTQARELTAILPRIRDIRRMGSAALDLCAVATGQVDAYFEAGMNEWDWAAGALIAREAGARVDGLRGKPPGRHTTLAANPVLFDRLHEVLLDSIDAHPSPTV